MANDDDYSDEDYEYFGNLLDQGIDPDEYTTLVDDDGYVIDEGTFGDFYENTLLTAEEFAEIYGEDYTITDLIYDLELAYDIEWDWDTWRELYGE